LEKNQSNDLRVLNGYPREEFILKFLNSTLFKVLVIQLLLWIVVFFDVPVVRPIFSLLYLSFIPGYLICNLIIKQTTNYSEKIFFSTGLSLIILLLVGLFVNNAAFMLGVSSPLTTINLLLPLNLVSLFAAFLNDKKNITTFQFNISRRIIPYLIILFILPATTVIGNLFSNIFGHFFFIIGIAAISIIVVIVMLSKKLVDSSAYPLLLFSIAITLMLQFFLLTPYLLGGGGDIFSEFYVFNLTHLNGHWNPTAAITDFEAAKGNAMLSVTILPEIINRITNIDGAMIFKAVIPFVASIALSMGLYVLYNTQTDKKISFLAVFFFLASTVGLGWGPSKQLIGEFFLILLLLVFVKKDLGTWQRSLLIILFGFGLIVSHYSLAFIFLIVMIFDFVANFLKTKRIDHSKLGLVLLFASIAFAWYIFCSPNPFTALVNSLSYIYSSVTTDFFNPASRGTEVLKGLGATTADSALHYVGRAFSYATELFLLLGFGLLLIKRINLQKQYKYFVYINFIFLLMAIVIPGLAGRFMMERWYTISLITLAPLAILGGTFLFMFIEKQIFKKKSLRSTR
jgi:uncharacterized membrane protein